MFCIAAVCCGLFIGGCAGFAAEAVSSIMITATLGPQQKQRKVKEEIVEEELDQTSTSSHGKQHIEENVDRQSNPMRPLRKESTTTARKSPPVLIRRMRLSPTPIPRKNSWDWDNED